MGAHHFLHQISLSFVIYHFKGKRQTYKVSKIENRAKTTDDYGGGTQIYMFMLMGVFNLVTFVNCNATLIFQWDNL